MYVTECPRCGRKIGPHEVYCKKCLRAYGRPVGALESHRGLHLVYTVLLVLANLGLILYLFWRSYL